MVNFEQVNIKNSIVKGVINLGEFVEMYMKIINQSWNLSPLYIRIRLSEVGTRICIWALKFNLL